MATNARFSPEVDDSANIYPSLHATPELELVLRAGRTGFSRVKCPEYLKASARKPPCREIIVLNVCSSPRKTTVQGDDSATNMLA